MPFTFFSHNPPPCPDIPPFLVGENEMAGLPIGENPPQMSGPNITRFVVGRNEMNLQEYFDSVEELSRASANGASLERIAEMAGLPISRPIGGDPLQNSRNG